MRAIICNGGYRTGSTLSFNIVMKIVERTKLLGINYKFAGPMPYKPVESFINLDPVFLTTKFVIKSHEYTPDVYPEDVKIIYTYRNPLAVAASNKNLFPSHSDDVLFDNVVFNYKNYIANSKKT